MQYIVLALLLFGVVPIGLSIIGMFITCFGVALVAAAPACCRCLEICSLL